MDKFLEDHSSRIANRRLHSMSKHQNTEKDRERMKHILFVGLLLVLVSRVDPTNALFQHFTIRRQSRIIVRNMPHFFTDRSIGTQFGDKMQSRSSAAIPVPRNGCTRTCSYATTDRHELDHPVPVPVVVDNDDYASEDDDDDDDEDRDAMFSDQSETDKFFDEAERDANRMNFPKGKPEGYYVTKHYSVPERGFGDLLAATDNDKDNENEGRKGGITQDEIKRLGISGTNITLPIALMLLDKKTYPSLSRARKSCRKGHIVVNRGPLRINSDTGKEEFDQDTCRKGRVIDRVYPGDVIGIQCRMRGGFYPGFDTTKPPFELPVVYEDSHFAIVNKPAGIVCYSRRDENHGVMTVRNALPFVLKPPKRGTSEIYLRPVGAHRLDKPTSGLLMVAKTKPALVNLTKQFEERVVKKTYTAIVNGIPGEPAESSITTDEAIRLGVDVDVDIDVGDDFVGEEEPNNNWQLIDRALDDKSAITVWRVVNYTESLKANDGTLTLVELKPRTGRYHQLRRHMAWVRECPLVGDVTYDGGGDATALRGRGLFLCSNKIRLHHPYYNTVEGRAEWEALPDGQKWANGSLALSEDGATVEVHASIDLPKKFRTFLETERKRYQKLGDSDP
mmetsp:Transcript_17951/g.49745  ORF Transcript_17951/g.49745 Transcript_17951/m.49745 type:complete len:619 (-) Transcript_17951:243-2099(-)